MDVKICTKCKIEKSQILVEQLKLLIQQDEYKKIRASWTNKSAVSQAWLFLTPFLNHFKIHSNTINYSSCESDNSPKIGMPIIAKNIEKHLNIVERLPIDDRHDYVRCEDSYYVVKKHIQIPAKGKPGTFAATVNSGYGSKLHFNFSRNLPLKQLFGKSSPTPVEVESKCRELLTNNSK